MQNKPKHILRKAKKNNFTQIDNAILDNKNMSWKAKGIICYLLRLPDDWELNKTHLGGMALDGETSFESGWAELKKLGYITSETLRDDKGKITKWIWLLHEEPEIKIISPTTQETQDVGFPDLENHPPTNTYSSTNTKEQQQAAAVFFPSLSSFNAPESEKIWVSKTYAESEVIKALEELTRVEVKTTPIQTLKWLLAEKPIIPPSKKDLIEQNMEMAKPMQGKETGGVRIDVNLDEVQFVFTTCQRSPESIRFEEVNFKERVRHYLKKYGFV